MDLQSISQDERMRIRKIIEDYAWTGVVETNKLHVIEMFVTDDALDAIQRMVPTGLLHRIP